MEGARLASRQITDTPYRRDIHNGKIYRMAVRTRKTLCNRLMEAGNRLVFAPQKASLQCETNSSTALRHWCYQILHGSIQQRRAKEVPRHQPLFGLCPLHRLPALARLAAHER